MDQRFILSYLILWLIPLGYEVFSLVYPTVIMVKKSTKSLDIMIVESFYIMMIFLSFPITGNWYMIILMAALTIIAGFRKKVCRFLDITEMWYIRADSLISFTIIVYTMEYINVLHLK